MTKEKAKRNYTTEEKANILSILVDRMANEGMSVREVCRKEPGFPTDAAIHHWIKDDESLNKQYARAKEDRADFFFEKIIEIALQVLTGEQKNPNAAKVAIDALKWVLCKMNNKKYGDKIQVDQNVTEQKRISDLFPEELKGMMEGGEEDE